MLKNFNKIVSIRLNYIHHTTKSIVDKRFKRIVLENLNVKGMMKNKHLSKAVQEQCFHEFKRQIEYKAKFYDIEVKLADRFYPSSKTCSCCGSIKKDLKLKDRVYICPECGYIIDRDYNAALNLAKYND